MAGAKIMAIEIVRDYFKKFDMDNKILEFPVSSRTVRLAAGLQSFSVYNC